MRTSLYSILCIGVRLAALLLVVNTVLFVPTGYVTAGRGDWTANQIGAFVGIWCLVLLFALWLWVYPGVLARLAAGKASQQIFESPISPEELQQIAFSIVGLWVLLAGLIGAADLVLRDVLVEHLLGETSWGVAGPARSRLIGDLITDVLRMLLGVTLVTRAQGLIGILRSFRERGLPQAVQETDDAKENA
ncbi:MAG TPA: hypothetical protein VFB32_09560 [Rudaea sp.]|nr:hypothetical protein [Rudaea sp.]